MDNTSWIIFAWCKYIWLTLINQKKFNPKKDEKLECVEYICDKIIHITKVWKNICFKTKVVNGTTGWIFLWCMILIYMN